MKLSTEMSVKDLVVLYKKRKQLVLNPAFQREGVWSRKDRVLLIDSIMKGYPLPAIFIYRRQDGHRVRYEVIDGKQRLETIFYFMGELKGEFSLFEGKVIDRDREEEVVEYSWKRMDKADRRTIQEFKLNIITVEGDPQKIEKIFVRINSTGKALSEGEILKAKYLNTPLFAALRSLAGERRIASALERMNVVNVSRKKRYVDVLLLAEIVMSVVKGGPLDKKKALDEMLSEKAKKLSAKDIQRELKAVREAILWAERIWLSEGDKGQKFSESRFRKTSDFYSLILLLAEYINKGCISDDRERNLWAKESLMRLDNELRKYRIKVKAGDAVEGVPGDVGEYRQSVIANADGVENRRIRRDVLDGLLGQCFVRKDRKRGFTRDERIYAKLRSYAQDGELRCYLCGEPIDNPDSLCCDGYTLDHMTAHKRGGKSVLNNARPAHRGCNSKKGARDIKREHKVFFDCLGAEAEGFYNYYSEKVVVLKGSRTASYERGVGRMKLVARLVVNGVLRPLKSGYKFRCDYKCTTSQAACILAGRATFNGPASWRLRDGTAVKDI